MYYLIDGHNLIARLPDISLEDPDDEAKLVLRLRHWTAANRKRRVIVVFDAGVFGGKAPHLSSGPVTVVFAPPGQTADTLLTRRIEKIKNPAEYLLVTSDREIIAAAANHHLPHRSSEAFAAELNPGRPETLSPAESGEPQLSAGEIAEWLELFGPEPVIPHRTRQGKAVAPPSQQVAETAPTSPAAASPAPNQSLKADDRSLSQEEIEEWLAIFRDAGSS